MACGNAKETILRGTKLLQKRAIRCINRSRYNSHTDPLFYKNSILKVKDLHELEIALCMYDFVHSTLPKSFNDMFHFNRQMNVVSKNVKTFIPGALEAKNSKKKNERVLGTPCNFSVTITYIKYHNF